eukprot:2507998-Amphidinium_carterae.1
MTWTDELVADGVKATMNMLEVLGILCQGLDGKEDLAFANGQISSLLAAMSKVASRLDTCREILEGQQSLEAQAEIGNFLVQLSFAMQECQTDADNDDAVINLDSCMKR